MNTHSHETARPAVLESETGRKPLPPEKARSHTRRLSLAITVVVAIVLLGGVWWVNHARTAAEMAGGGAAGRHAFWEAAVPVVAQTAQKGDIDVYMNGLGTVTSPATVTVTTRISGELTEVAFKEGQEVKAGDLLAVIDPRPYQVALEQAEGQLLQAQAQLAQAKSDLTRYETLSRQDSIAIQQVSAQRALVSQYEGLVKTDQAAIDNAKLNLVYCHITAPISGRVGLRQVDRGNYVTPSDTTGIVTLTQIRPISVIFTLPEDAYSQVATRLRSGAQIPVDAYDSSQTQKLATGALEAIDNEADTSTGTFKLRATFPNVNEALFPNEFVNIRMLLDVNHGVIVMPTSAVELGQLGSYVYVIQNDNTVTARAIKLGTTQGDRVAVTSGLNVGDRVVVEGADRLREGGQVTVQQAGVVTAATGTTEFHGSGHAGERHWQGGQRHWRGRQPSAGHRPTGKDNGGS